jgi:hypothetical protein
LHPATFYWSFCTKSWKWAVFICVLGVWIFSFSTISHLDFEVVLISGTIIFCFSFCYRLYWSVPYQWTNTRQSVFTSVLDWYRHCNKGWRGLNSLWELYYNVLLQWAYNRQSVFIYQCKVNITKLFVQTPNRLAYHLHKTSIFFLLNLINNVKSNSYQLIWR